MAPVIQNSMSESLCSTFCDGSKENKVGWASYKWNSGILVADTDSESGAEASDLEDEFSESKELEASAQEDEPQAATSGRGSPTWGPPQGRNIKIYPFVGPAIGLRNINKDSSTLALLMLFFTDIFLLLVEQTNLYYQQHLDRQARPSRRHKDIHCLSSADGTHHERHTAWLLV